MIKSGLLKGTGFSPYIKSAKIDGAFSPRGANQQDGLFHAIIYRRAALDACSHSVLCDARIRSVCIFMAS